MFRREYCGPYSFLCCQQCPIYTQNSRTENILLRNRSSPIFHHPLFLSTPSIVQHLLPPNPLIRFNYLQSFPSLFISNIIDTARCFANTISVPNGPGR